MPAVDNAITEEQHQLNRRTEFIAHYKSPGGAVSPGEQQAAAKALQEEGNNQQKPAQEMVGKPLPEAKVPATTGETAAPDQKLCASGQYEFQRDINGQSQRYREIQGKYR
ncbi:MAG: NUDIX hydrolase [Marinilabiliales bacterium]|nr:NUDIX hydrolase [Marinilabiliales bacterium]